MTPAISTPELSERDTSLRPALLVVLAALALRVVYFLWLSPYDLVEDEAQYWLWSKHLDWSYSTKGPGVAWTIWLATRLLGEDVWAIRLPSALFSAIGALAAAALTRDIVRATIVPLGPGWCRPSRVAWMAALGYTLVPVLAGAGALMTIDAPYVACWSVACWAGWQAIGWSHGKPRRAMEGDGERAWSIGWEWALLGAAIGIGFLFKYTILLLVPGLLAYWVWRRVRARSADPAELAPAPRHPWMPRLWGVLGVALALAGLAPVLIWNSQNDWATLRHLLGHLGMRGGDMPVAPNQPRTWSPLWLPELIGQQIGMVGPWLALALLPFVSRRDEPSRAGRAFLLLAAAPILIFYTVVALLTEPEGNWPMAAYATLVPLGAWVGADAIAVRRTGFVRGARLRVRLWRIGLTYAAIALVLTHFLPLFTRTVAAAGVPPGMQDRLARMEGRVRGARQIAGRIGELVAELESATGKEAFVICQHYGRASQIAYYLKPRIAPAERTADGRLPSLSRVERPLVLCAMRHTGGRISQFDFWEDTRLDNPALYGRPAVIVTSNKPETLDTWRTFFDRIEPIPGGKLPGETKPDRSAFLGYGYRPPTIPRP